MNETVQTAQEGGGIVLASFGSGNRAGRASTRASGPQGRRAGSTAAHAGLRAQARRVGAQGGRGARERRAAAREIEAAASGRRRLSNRQIAQLHGRLRALRGR